MRLLLDTHTFLWFVLNDPQTTLPLHHRDPFDPLIIAQAIIEGMPIVSVDVALDPYPVNRLW